MWPASPRLWPVCHVRSWSSLLEIGDPKLAGVVVLLQRSFLPPSQTHVIAKCTQRHEITPAVCIAALWATWQLPRTCNAHSIALSGDSLVAREACSTLRYLQDRFTRVVSLHRLFLPDIVERSQKVTSPPRRLAGLRCVGFFPRFCRRTEQGTAASAVPTRFRRNFSTPCCCSGLLFWAVATAGCCCCCAALSSQAMVIVQNAAACSASRLSSVFVQHGCSRPCDASSRGGSGSSRQCQWQRH